MNKEVKMFQTSDYNLKEKIVKEFIKERVSYLQQSRYLSFVKRWLTGTNEVYALYVDKNQYDQANEILKKIKNSFDDMKMEG